MALRDVIDVLISLAISGITRVGFNTALFTSSYPVAPVSGIRVREFADADEAAADAELNAGTQLAISRFFGGDLRTDRVKIAYKTDAESWTDALNIIQDTDNDWSVLMVDESDITSITEISTWVQPRAKLFVAKTANPAVRDPLITTDIGSTLLAAEKDATGLIWSGVAATDYPDMAWAGGLLPVSPGRATWAFKRVPGIPADAYTGAQVSAVEAKRVTRIENILGISRTLGGYTSRPGLFIDVRRGMDYVAQRMAEDLYFLLTQQSEKVPGDDRGSAMVENVIKSRLRTSVAENIFVDNDNLKAFVPSFAERDPVDRENRLLQGVTFEGNLVGAIHKIIVRGTVGA